MCSSRVIIPYVVETYNNQEEQKINDPQVNNESVVEQPQEVVLRRSHRDRKSTISTHYVVYLQESENDLSIDNELVSFSEAINDDNFDKWLDAMKDELKSMTQNDVWDLVEYPKGCKRVGCKQVFKTKCDSQGDEDMTTSLEAPSRRITRSMSRGESSIPSPLSLFCITLV